MLTISQIPNFNKREEPVPIEAPKVEAPALGPDVTTAPHINFTYSGYSYDKRDNIRLAIINGNIYHKGDSLPDNHVLKSINPTYIIIRNKADKSELVVPLYK
jgi:hypothetical protein